VSAARQKAYCGFSGIVFKSIY